jgi:hypothetical protein
MNRREFGAVLLIVVFVASLAASCREGPAHAGRPAQTSAATDRSAHPAEPLVIAAFRLDVEEVRRLLAAGAPANGRFGRYDKDLFRDPWTLGYSYLGSENWTALLAVAHSNRAPDPPHETKNTIEDLDRARRELLRVDPALIRERDARRVQIAKLLIAAGAQLDVDDGYGATALYQAVYYHYEDLALLLIDAGANVNTRTGVYIDGPGDLTPLHYAHDNPRLVEALIAHGADVNAKDSGGATPLDWAIDWGKVKSVQLLKAAGARSAVTR